MKLYRPPRIPFAALLLGILLPFFSMQAQEPKTIAPQDAHDYDTSIRILDGTSFNHGKYLKNKLYVNHTDRRLRVYDISGNQLLEINHNQEQVREAFSSSPNGDIYIYRPVINHSSSEAFVYQYDSNGTFIRRFGPDGSSEVGFPSSYYSWIGDAQLHISASTGRVYLMPVLEAYINSSIGNDNAINALIYVFESDGTFVKTINTNGILADNLEGIAESFLIGTTVDGTEQLWVENDGSGFMTVGESETVDRKTIRVIRPETEPDLEYYRLQLLTNP